MYEFPTSKEWGFLLYQGIYFYMDVNVIKFRRRLSDSRMIERMKDLLEDEMDDSDPCNYLGNPEEWKEMILEGTTFRIWSSYHQDELFDYFDFDNTYPIYKVIHQYCLTKFSNRIKFVFEDRTYDCD